MITANVDVGIDIESNHSQFHHSFNETQVSL